MADNPVPEDRSFIVAPFGPTIASRLFPSLESFPGQVFWSPTLTSKSHEVRVARREIVRQARQVERSSEPIRGGLDRFADMAAGPALRVHPQPDWDSLGIDDPEARKELVKAMRREFNNWAYDSRLLCDAEGHYNFGGMMWMAFRNLAGPDAESALVIHYDEERMAKYNARWATFVTVLDPDRIETPAEFSADPNQFQGRKLDANGRMIGMWVYKNHPSDYSLGALPSMSAGVAPLGYSAEDYEYVPRETDFGRPMAIHWFVKTRGMQQRGMSPLANVIKQNNMLRSFDDSYLAAAVINSSLATYIKTKSSAAVVGENLAPAPNAATGFDGAAEWSYFGAKVDYYGKTKVRVGGAGGGPRIPVLPPDDEIVMESVGGAINDPAPFRNGFLREFASALGIGYEQLSLNYSEANYSSARAALLEVWRGVLRIRTMFTGHVATPIYGCVIEEAIARGRIVLPAGAPPFQENRTAYIACAWTGPGMGWIDPKKEADGYKTLIDMRVTNRSRVAAERGDDFFEILAETADEYAAADLAEVELDDPLPMQTVPDAQVDEDGDPVENPSPAPAKKPAAKPKGA